MHKSTVVFVDPLYGAKNTMMTLGANIRHHRSYLGLTLGQLSELSGVDVGTISALENRNSERSKHATAIAKAFGMTVEELEAGTKAATPTYPPEQTSPSRIQEERGIYVRDDAERLLLDAYRAASPGMRQAMTALAKEAVKTFSKRTGNGN